LFSSATGREKTAEELLQVGERVHNIGKALNTLHAGFTREDDYPPKRLVEEPIKHGPHKGASLDLEEWDEILNAYYQAHGWDKNTGWQTLECLEKNQMGWATNKLKQYDRLP
jgi:aldehyde:ferredoxin oxidoreductase